MRVDRLIRELLAAHDVWQEREIHLFDPASDDAPETFVIERRGEDVVLRMSRRARPITNSAFILRLMRELRNDGRPERQVLIAPADGGRPLPVGDLDTGSDWWWTLSVAR